MGQRTDFAVLNKIEHIHINVTINELLSKLRTKIISITIFNVSLPQFYTFDLKKMNRADSEII